MQNHHIHLADVLTVCNMSILNKYTQDTSLHELIWSTFTYISVQSLNILYSQYVIKTFHLKLESLGLPW